MNIHDVHLKLRPPIMIFVVDVIESLDNLLQTGDKLMPPFQAHQRPTKLPVCDGRIEHQVMTPAYTKHRQANVSIFLLVVEPFR